MKPKILLLSVFITFTLLQVANANAIKDSFLLLIADPNVDAIVKSEVSSKLSGFYILNNKDSAQHYLDLTLKYSRESGDEYHIIDAQILLVSVNKDEWGFDSTMVFYKNLLKDPAIEKYIDLKKTIINDLGVAYGDSGDQLTGVDYAIQALELSYEMGDSLEIGRSIVNIAVQYINMSMNELALEKFRESERIFRELDHKSFQAFALTGIANVFDNLGQVDSAYHYSHIMMDVADQAEIINFRVSARISLGQILNSMKRYEESLDYFQLAYDLSEEIGDEFNMVNCLCNLGAGHYYLDKYSEALSFYEKALSYDMTNNNHLVTQTCAKELAYTYEKLGRNDEAIKYFKDYVNYQDTVLLKENKEVIASIEAKYNVAVKEAELEQQKAETSRKTYQRNLLTGGLGLSMLLGGSLIWGLLNRSRKNKTITTQERNIQNQKIESLEQEKKLLSMSSLLEGQENERIRIAKDLHDGLGGLLTTVKAHFGKIQSEIDQVESLDIYQSANKMIDKAHDEVRRISHNLMPSDLRAGGLPIAIRQLVHELKTVHEIKTEFELLGFSDERLGEKVELTVYRITQELINNIVKYAETDKVFIQLSKFENDIQIVVEDDGVGFDYESAMKSSGLGLKSISSRVEQQKGHIDINSSSGNGTSVTINIPF